MSGARNQFSALDLLGSDEYAPFPHSNPVQKGATRDATLIASKQQRPQGPHRDAQQPRNRPPFQNSPAEFAATRGRKENFYQRDGRPQHRPPRMQRQQIEATGICLPPPGCCDPCHPVSPPPSNIDRLNAQLKQEIFALLQKPQPDNVCQPIPAPEPQKVRSPACVQPPGITPIPPAPALRQPNPCVPEGHDKQPPPTPVQSTKGREEAPCTPEVVSCAPVDANVLLDSTSKLNVSLPAPPGLPRPRGRGRGRGGYNHRGRALAGPTRADPCSNPMTEDSNFERHNDTASIARIISPPPSDAALNPVKLPTSKDAQHVPPSPTVSNSSLSDDLSGSSFTRFGSDTTFTSVESNVSSKNVYHGKGSHQVCRNWLKGYKCFTTPCRYLHLQNNATQPEPQAPPAPQTAPCHSPHPVTQPTARGFGQKGEKPSRRQEPPKIAELAPRPERLYATTISDHIKVQFDQGFEVREVMTGFESRWVHIGNIDARVTSKQLHKLLAPYNVETINLPESSGKPVMAKIQFASCADAIKAVSELNGIELSRKTISAKLAINNSKGGATILVDTDVQVVWQCPSRVGYAGYDTLKDARVAIDSLHGFAMDGLVVTAQLYEGLPCVGAYNVIFKHLPAHVDEQKFGKFASSKAVMLGRPNYQSLDKAMRSIRSRLEEYGTVTAFDILPAPYRDGLVKAWARFMSPVEARAAQEDFDHRRPGAIGHSSISCRHVLSVTHTLNSAGYKRMREDISWLRWSWQRRYGPSVSIREKVKENAEDDMPAIIRLSSEQPELLSSLKYEFEQLLRGETITLDKKPLWDDFLTAPAGWSYIAQVQARYPGIGIQVQKNRRAISLWGPIVLRHRARQDIVRRVMELKAQQFWKIPLSGKLLSIFCSTELTTLQELLGPENCILDYAERVLLVRGNDLAFRTACNAVQDAQSKQGNESSSSDMVCPVCFGDAVVPVSLACGHQWCRACLTGYLNSAVGNKMFPLQCLGDDASCSQSIPLGLARKLLSAADFNAVIEAAFWVYVHSRPDEFHHCPTPDCTQVYRTAPPNAVLQCPSCLVRICPACRIEYHDGMTCEERDVAEDKLFQEWTSNHDVKSCPGCKAPIERSEGCNHMTCTRCQTHSCWECLATFPRGQGIYEHMRIQHGGIGL